MKQQCKQCFCSCIENGFDIKRSSKIELHVWTLLRVRNSFPGLFLKVFQNYLWSFYHCFWRSKAYFGPYFYLEVKVLHTSGIKVLGRTKFTKLFLFWLLRSHTNCSSCIISEFYELENTLIFWKFSLGRSYHSLTCWPGSIWLRYFQKSGFLIFLACWKKRVTCL